MSEKHEAPNPLQFDSASAYAHESVVYRIEHMLREGLKVSDYVALGGLPVHYAQAVAARFPAPEFETKIKPRTTSHDAYSFRVELHVQRTSG